MTSIVDRPITSSRERRRARVLVTGGAGFVASHVVDALVERGCDVLVLDDLSTGHAANLPGGVELVCADICASESTSVVERYRPDAVVHAAAQPSVSVSVERPSYDARVNILGGLQIADAALRAGASHFLYVNTGGALYGRPRYLPVDEAHPVEPLSPYGLSKWTLEQYLTMTLAPAMRLKVLRLANVYGPRQDPAGEAGVVAVFADRMLSGLPVTIHGDGQQTRDFIYVGDVAAAAVAALDHADALTVNISTGQACTITELFQTIARLTGYRVPAQYGAAREGDVRESVLSNDRARAILGWCPAVSLEKGLQATFASLATTTHTAAVQARLPWAMQVRDGALFPNPA
jgi:UDP-glucose 4-epimerase